MSKNRAAWRDLGKIAVLLCLLFCGLRPVFADGDEVNPDRLQVRANWWFSQPGGYFKSDLSEGGGSVDLHRDLGFSFLLDFFRQSGLEICAEASFDLCDEPGEQQPENHPDPDD